MSVNELSLPQNTIVSRINAADLGGFFSKEVTVPLGCRTLVFEDGRSVGEITSGTYTLETFLNKIRLPRPKQIVLYLFRENQISLVYPAKSFLSKENQRVECSVRISFRISDAAMLVKNLIGTGSAYTFGDLMSDTADMVLDGLQAAFSQHTLEELNNADARLSLEAAAADSTRLSLGRCGLEVQYLSVVSLSSEGYDRIQDMRRQVWLVREGAAVTDESNEVKNAVRLSEIKQEEAQNELELLQRQVAADKEDSRLSILRRRIGQRMELRDVVQTDKFNAVSSENALKQFLFENEKNALLRDDEKRELQETLASEHTEKSMRREHAVDMLNAQLKNDYEEFQLEYAYRLKLKTLDREAEIAKRTDNEENRKWLQLIERQAAERKEEHKRLEDEKIRIGKLGDIELIQAQKNLDLLQFEQRRVMIDLEIQKARDDAEFERQKRDDEWKIYLKEKEDDLKDKAMKRKLEDLAAIEALNAEAEKRELESYCGKKQADNALETHKLDVNAEVEKERIRAEAAKADNEARTEAAVNKAVADQMREMMKLQADTNREANARVDSAAEKMMAAFANIMANQPQPQTVIVPGNGTVQAAGGGVMQNRSCVMCPKCRAENDPVNKFCSNCGERL